MSPVRRAEPAERCSRWGAACLGLVLGGTLLAACRDEPAAAGSAGAPGNTAAVAAGPVVVFLGDSLTAGLGLSEQEALPALIQQKLDAAHPGLHAVNAGRSGDTTAGGLARIDWYLKDSLDLRALVIGLGSNDAMRGLPVETVEDNLRKIIRRTRERKPSAQIYLWELLTFPNLGQDYAAAYAALFPRVASSENVTLIPFPLAPVAGHPELNQPDGIHPTAEGTQRVAERIWQSLGPRL